MCINNKNKKNAFVAELRQKFSDDSFMARLLCFEKYVGVCSDVIRYT